MATAATAKRKPGLRDSARKFGQDVKRSAQQKMQKAKRYATDYYGTLEHAFDIGYQRGFDDAGKIPKRFGSTLAAATGYGSGVKHYRRVKKHNARYNRKRK